MWHSVALSSAIPKTQKCKKNTFYSMFKIWMWHYWRYVALFDPDPRYPQNPRYPQTRKAEKKNANIANFKIWMWHCVALSNAILKPKIFPKTQNFQISKIGCGTAMWRYPQTLHCKKHTQFLNFRVRCGTIWR